MSLSDLLAQPTFRSTKGRVPVYRPLLNGEEFDITVQEAAFILSEGAHESIILNVTSPTLTDTEEILDQPISFFYGQAPRTELFTGYVVSVKETQAGRGSLSFTMLCLGPTKVMQAGTPRFIVGKTVPAAVENLVQLNGLGFTGHAHTHLWKAMAQTQESDWQQCVSMAKRLGWSIFNRYGVVSCQDPALLLRENGPYARLVSAQDKDFKSGEDRRLIEFTPGEESDDAPQNMGAKFAYFTDRNQVQVMVEPGTFKRYSFKTNTVIYDNNEAEVYTNAAKSRMEEWKQTAEARMWGDADIFPGMCVDILTANRAYYKSKYDGRWLVRSVQHQMDTQSFQTNLNLSRPDGKTQVTQSVYVPFWQAIKKSKPALTLQDKVWISSWSDPRVRSVL